MAVGLNKFYAVTFRL